MAISAYHSIVTMPKIEKPYPTILDFLAKRFPYIDREIWKARISCQKVLFDNGESITLDSSYAPLKRIYYFREVEKESIIPFTEKIIFCNDDLLVRPFL